MAIIDIRSLAEERRAFHCDAMLVVQRLMTRGRGVARPVHSDGFRCGLLSDGPELFTSVKSGRVRSGDRYCEVVQRDQGFALTQLDSGGKVQILLQKSFWGNERQFSGTLTRVARDDVRDHVVPRKNDHEPA
jgi:hypothetical protein